MVTLLGVIFVFVGLYLFYVAVQLFHIPDDEYMNYKKGLPNIRAALSGEVNSEYKGMVYGDAIDIKTGKLKPKSSYYHV